MTDENVDPNQDAANEVKQRGTDATVDLGESPTEQARHGIGQEGGEPIHYSGDVRDTVNDDVEETGDPER